jgi:hypothetical protein
MHKKRCSGGVPIYCISYCAVGIGGETETTYCSSEAWSQGDDGNMLELERDHDQPIEHDQTKNM